MKILLSWLNDFVKIDNIPLETLVKKLTGVGFEIDEIINKSKGLEKVISAKITKITQHPNADKLVVCKADIGSDTVQIVTGAKNMKEGDIVALAQDGANLPCGKKIRTGEIRGEKSQGMFCGGDELNINNNIYPNAENDGLLILGPDTKIGEPMAKVLGLDEVVLDVKILPNRPDCNSVIGIAREVAAAFGLKFTMPKLTFKTHNSTKNIKVEVQNKKHCTRYMGVVVENIKNGPSPEFIRKRLILTEHTPHSLFVDITNYVLTEIGQPMHAFDLSKIKGKIIVRDAKKGEKLQTLDGNTYTLNPNNLVIADAEKALVVAGVLGGVDSGTYTTTKDVFLESAIFDGANIRHTKNALGIVSDAGVRYSKGVYNECAELGMRRALNLVDSLGVGIISSVIEDENFGKTKPIAVKSNITNINQTLGLGLNGEQMAQYLNNLGLITTISGKTLSTQIPEYRTDISLECDIIEEIGRSVGYDNLTEGITPTKTIFYGNITLQQQNINTLRLTAAAEGFVEAVNYQFVSPKWIGNFGQDENTHIKLANPIGQEYSIMRKSLLNGLINTLSFNINQGNKNLYLFELGRIYEPKQLPMTELPNEHDNLALVLNADGEDFFSLKQSVDKIGQSLGLTFEYKQAQIDFLHPGIAAEVYLYNKKIGLIGELHPKVSENFEISKKVYVAEIDLSQVLVKNTDAKTGKAPDKLPLIERDLAFVVGKDIPAGNILSSAKKCARNEISDVFVFDVYEGSQVPANKKSIAIKFFIKQNENTLTDSEINAVMNKIIEAEQRDNKAELRV
ncbi:MAG: phenylalanine--tRNA ligase subunit beta [Christensenellaceae bacterium]|nr:phenylalanine--tRNA ligase subunit beta [Christensenellaceae bacterium]